MAAGTGDELDRKIRRARASIALSLQALSDAELNRQDVAHLRTAIARQRDQLQLLLEQEATARSETTGPRLLSSLASVGALAYPVVDGSH